MKTPKKSWYVVTCSRPFLRKARNGNCPVIRRRSHVFLCYESSGEEAVRTVGGKIGKLVTRYERGRIFAELKKWEAEQRRQTGINTFWIFGIKQVSSSTKMLQIL